MVVVTSVFVSPLVLCSSATALQYEPQREDSQGMYGVSGGVYMYTVHEKTCSRYVQRRKCIHAHLAYLKTSFIQTSVCHEFRSPGCEQFVLIYPTSCLSTTFHKE